MDGYFLTPDDDGKNIDSPVEVQQASPDEKLYGDPFGEEPSTPFLTERDELQMLAGGSDDEDEDE